MKLFIIPFAGGMSSTYLTWKDKIKNCSVTPIILRGRESRVSEGLYRSFEEAVDDISNEILDILDEIIIIFKNEKMTIDQYSKILKIGLKKD